MIDGNMQVRKAPDADPKPEIFECKECGFTGEDADFNWYTDFHDADNSTCPECGSENLKEIE